MSKVDFLYDYSEDNLYLYKEEKSYGSIEFGENIVIDFDKNLNVVALEFFNASKVLTDLTGKTITKKLLKGMKKATLVSERKGGLIIAFFKIFLAQEITIEQKLSLQDIKYESPVLMKARAV